MCRQFGGSRSEQLDRARRAIEPVNRGSEATAEHAARHDRQLDRPLQQIWIEQNLMLADALTGVAVEATTLRSGIDQHLETASTPQAPSRRRLVGVISINDSKMASIVNWNRVDGYRSYQASG